MRFSKYPVRVAWTFHLRAKGDKRYIPAALIFRFLAAALIASAFLPALASKTASISGLVFTLDSNRIHTVCPNARVILRGLSTRVEISTVSNDLGEYLFTGVLPGDYEITATLAGFDRLAKRLALKSGESAKLDFQLILKGQTQTINVNADSPGIDLTSSSGGAPTLTAKTLKSVVELNQDFQESLPLLPGVVRGLDGLIRIKGGRTNQANTLVNSASVTDPFTGQAALSLPAAAVQSVRVLSNPFSAEYGRFSSGVVDVNTRNGTDAWKFLFEDPVPRFRWLGGRIHGIESASPHLTFSGPLKKGDIYIFQSIGYGYDSVRVYSIPDPNNVRVIERINSYTQLDWNASVNQRLSVAWALDPQNTDYANINTFNPQPVTADYHQRGFFTSATHRWILDDGGFLQSLFSAKQLDAHVFPAERQAGEMTLYPASNSGSYFADQQRNTSLYQWSQTLHWRPVNAAGRHLLTLGYFYAYSSYGGQISDLPFTVLRQDGTISSTISYGGALGSQATKNDISLFVQDNWQALPRLVLDLGLRLDHDSLSAQFLNGAPRIGFVFAPDHDGRTAVRGGVGLFYDKIPFNVAVFTRYPAQTITSYAGDGVTVVGVPTTYTHEISTPGLRVPYSLGWAVQADRELRGVFLRLGWEGRQVYREFLVNPFSAANGNARLRLLNNGKQNYQELLAMVRWQPTERSSIYASYVHSRAYGDLNDYNEFFGNFPYPLIRPNQYGPLSVDTPNRGLFWGIIGLPHKVDFVPILDVHTGFPFSRLDQNWKYLGLENQAGRFPAFLALDTKAQYPVDLKFHGHRLQFRAGVTVYNVLNHFNPRDVQQYYASPDYGTFYNSVPHLLRIDGDFDF
jgi:outer membrane receptor protein involved in Fe transport